MTVSHWYSVAGKFMTLTTIGSVHMGDEQYGTGFDVRASQTWPEALQEHSHWLMHALEHPARYRVRTRTESYAFVDPSSQILLFSQL